MHKLVIVAMVGVVAQLVDGALGMAYGVTSTTLLVATGSSPAIASAAVHLAEVGTTLASGTAHSRLGNVDWRTVRLLALPGALGGFLGAVALSSLDAAAAKPFVAVLLIGLGVYVLHRTLHPSTRATSDGPPLSKRFLRSLGFGAGALDAMGGGGWGPVGTPTLLASGRLEPRMVVGSVSTAEFLVALGASSGFLLSLSWSDIPVGTVLALLAGGVVAAPLAALLVRLLAPRTLGVFVSAAILLTNARTLALAAGLGAGWHAAMYGTVLLVVTVATVRTRRRGATTREAEPSEPHASEQGDYRSSAVG